MKYAIVESGGKQYRAVEGGTLEVDRLPFETGANIKLDQILLLADGDAITVGTPLIKDNPVWAKVLEHFKGDKVTIFNYSPKKRIRVKTGHRQNYTRLLVEQIGGSELIKRETVEKVVEANAETEAPEMKEEKTAEVKAAAPKEKKPAAKAVAAKTAAKSASAKTAEKKPAVKVAAKKPVKAAPKPAAKKATTKKPSEAKK